MRYWFVPAWCGDFRIERESDFVARLTVVDPTAEDRARLSPFLARVAREQRVLEPPDGAATPVAFASSEPVIALRGETVVWLSGTVTELGTWLTDEVHADGPVWTAIRFESGRFSLSDGSTPPAASSPEAEAAASVKPPRRGCPAPTAAERRASEVLRCFTSERQWASFQAEGRMRVIGGQTGRSYWVHHRDEAAARRLPRCVIEAASGEPICAWDDRVPPEEEVLGLKLALEHRERWLLQESRGGHVPRPPRGRVPRRRAGLGLLEA